MNYDLNPCHYDPIHQAWKVPMCTKKIPEFLSRMQNVCLQISKMIPHNN